MNWTRMTPRSALIAVVYVVAILALAAVTIRFVLATWSETAVEGRCATVRTAVDPQLRQRCARVPRHRPGPDARPRRAERVPAGP